MYDHKRSFIFLPKSWYKWRYLTNTINNIITSAIFNLEYLGRVEEMDRINQYQIKIGRNDRFLAIESNNNGGIIEGTYDLGGA